MAKLYEEFKALKNILLSDMQSKEELLNRAYEFAWKESILEAMNSLDEAKLIPICWDSLCNMKYPLDHLYRLWMKSDCSFQDELEEIMITGLTHERGYAYEL